MPKKIYIVDNYLQYDLQNSLLDQNNILTDLVFYDLKSFISTYYTNDCQPLNAQISMYSLLKHSKTTIYSPLISTISFIKELYQIKEAFESNDEDINNLDQSNRSTKDLLYLLDLCKDIKTAGYYLKKASDIILNNHDYSNVVLVNQYPQNSLEDKILKHLILSGATKLDINTKPTHIEYNYALNKRCEVEAVALNIVALYNKNIPLSDINVLVTSVSEYEHLIAFIFNRYNIPYYLNGGTIYAPIKDFFKVLLRYFKKPDIDSFKALLTSAYLNFKQAAKTINYIDALQLSYDDLFQPFDNCAKLADSPFLSNYSALLLADYEKSANELQSEYISFINRFNRNNIANFFEDLFNYFITHQQRLNFNDISIINSFKAKLNESIDDLSKLAFEDALAYALIILDNCEIKNERLSNCVLISDINKPYLKSKFGYVLGLHQGAYPSFSGMSGILSENVIAKLPAFLSLDYRYNQHLKRLEGNLQMAEQLTLFYPQSSFEGKSYEASLELKMAFKLEKAHPYTIEENNYQYHRTYNLSPENAQQIFFSDNSIKGSISAFENYFNCPYAYFLKYGIKLKGLFHLDIKEAEIGTLQHAFLENIVKKYGKQYPEVSAKEISDFIDEQFNDYQRVFTKKSAIIEQTKQQIKRNLQSVTNKLAAIEDHSTFEPDALEYRIQTDLLTYKDITIKLTGIIDRLDKIAQGVRIIDYKSSDKKLEMPKFYAGLALQLLTYAYVVSKQLNKKVFGVYYYSLKNKKTAMIARSIKRPVKKGEPYEIMEVKLDELLAQSTNKLVGKTFVQDSSDLELLDSSCGKYISDIKAGNKKELEDGIKAKVYGFIPFDDICTDLETLYQYLIDKLLAGDISCQPIEGACKYCEYHSICKFRGKERKVEPIIIKETEEK